MFHFLVITYYLTQIFILYFVLFQTSYSSDEDVMTGDGEDNRLMCRKILNTFNGKRMISKPEASVLISLNMDLVTC